MGGAGTYPVAGAPSLLVHGFRTPRTRRGGGGWGRIAGGMTRCRLGGVTWLSWRPYTSPSQGEGGTATACLERWGNGNPCPTGGPMHASLALLPALACHAMAVRPLTHLVPPPPPPGPWSTGRLPRVGRPSSGMSSRMNRCCYAGPPRALPCDGNGHEVKRGLRPPQSALRLRLRLRLSLRLSLSLSLSPTLLVIISLIQIALWKPVHFLNCTTRFHTTRSCRALRAALGAGGNASGPGECERGLDVLLCNFRRASTCIVPGRCHTPMRLGSRILGGSC
jgi:hypothetical protein